MGNKQALCKYCMQPLIFKGLRSSLNVPTN
jgi:hypothetical protein